MKTLAVVGIGYWGKNLIRVFQKISNIKTCVHTGNPANEEWVNENFPSISITTNYETILDDPEIDAVVIATPIKTHYPLTKKALLSGKHIFVEKPLATNAQQAKELKDISEENKMTLFVGYIFCYHPTLQPIFDRAEDQSIKWARFSWDKLGEFSRNIYYDVVTHTVALALQLFSTFPEEINLISAYKVKDRTDIASIRLIFPNNKRFEIMVSRLSPNSQKSLQILLEDEFLAWNESGLYKFNGKKFEKIKETGEEPLLTEAKQFVSTIEQKSSHRTTAKFGYQVGQIIDQLTKYDDSE